MVRIILVLLLLASVAVAQPSPRLDSIQAAVVEQLGLATSTGTARLINRAYLQVCHDYDAYLKFDTLLLDSISGITALPSDCDRVKGASVLLAGGVRKTLRSLVDLPQDSVFDRIGEEYEPTTDSAKQNYYQAEGGYIYTFPRWNGGDTLDLEISYYAIPANLDTATDSIQTDGGFYNAVFYSACAEVQAKRGRLTEAAFYRKLVWALFGIPKGVPVE